MDVYKMLQEILDLHPTGAPESVYFEEILRTLFTEDEASVAVHMNFSPTDASVIAKKAGKTIDETSPLLEGMAKKVVIFSKEKNGKMMYGLVPTIPGLFEYPFMQGGGTPMHDKLGDLWRKYHKESLGDSFAGSKTPQIRVVPVGKSLTSISYAHPYEEVENLILNSDYISLAHCACRVSMKRCDAPTEVCMIFGSPGKFLVEQGYAREINKDEGIEVLKKAEEAGLVHTSNNSKDKATIICNCCSCCCTVLRGATELNNPNAFATSAWLPVWNPILCTRCGNCADNRCPMNAIRMIGNFVDIEEEFCIGCGLCVSGCPEEALTLTARKKRPEIPETIKDMAMSVLKEKGKLDKYNDLMKK